jgi:hypothetical protein
LEEVTRVTHSGADLIATALLAAVAVVVGFLIGAVGVGGILLIPALVLLGGMPIHQASATALFSFLFTGLVGTWLFHRRGSIDWRMTVPVCVGAVVLSYVGAMANSMVEARPLALIIALSSFSPARTFCCRHGAAARISTLTATPGTPSCCSASARSPDSAPGSPARAVRSFRCR